MGHATLSHLPANEHTMSLSTHTGANWRVDLPEDWRQEREDDGVAYFESFDHKRGLYIAVWQVPEARRPASEVVAEFAAMTMANQDALPEHHWVHKTAPLGDGGDLLIESVDEARGYRVLTRVIVQMPLVLRAAFHDYGYVDVPKSNEALHASLQSVMLMPA